MRRTIKTQPLTNWRRPLLLLGALTGLLLWLSHRSVDDVAVLPKTEAKPVRVVERGTSVKEFAEPKKVLTSEEIETGRW